MTYQTLISQESLRHPLLDHVRVILTSREPELTYADCVAAGWHPVDDRLHLDAKDGGGPLQVVKTSVKRRGGQDQSVRVTRSVHVNGHRALHDSGVPRPSGDTATCGTNYVASEPRLTGLVDVAQLSEICAGVVWQEIERQRRHARDLMRTAFSSTQSVRRCFCRSLKEIELTCDVPTSQAVTLDRVHDALQWCFPGSATVKLWRDGRLAVEAPLAEITLQHPGATGKQDWEVVVEASLADFKIYPKDEAETEAHTDSSNHKLIRFEAVLRNYNKGETPRYRWQISRALQRFRSRHPELLAPTGVRFSSADELARRVGALAEFVVEEYLWLLCRFSLNHSIEDRLQATERSMQKEHALVRFQRRTVAKVVALLDQYRGQIPTGKINGETKTRLINASILKWRKWGRFAFLTTGDAVDRQLGLLGDVGTDAPNPTPILDGHRITGWEHRVALSVDIA